MVVVHHKSDVSKLIWSVKYKLTCAGGGGPPTTGPTASCRAGAGSAGAWQQMTHSTHVLHGSAIPYSNMSRGSCKKCCQVEQTFDGIRKRSHQGCSRIVYLESILTQLLLSWASQPKNRKSCTYSNHWLTLESELKRPPTSHLGKRCHIRFGCISLNIVDATDNESAPRFSDNYIVLEKCSFEILNNYWPCDVILASFQIPFHYYKISRQLLRL